MNKILSSESGHLLITLVVALVISMILLTVAAQAWTTVIRRDKEEELIFRGNEYSKALRNFQKDRGRLPADLKELIERGQSNQRYIRKLYKDPMSPDGEWNYLYMTPDGRSIVNPNAPAVRPGEGAGDQSEERDEFSIGSQEGNIPQTSFNAEGARIAGLPIAGVVSKSAEKAYRVYRKKEYYNEWEFTIFDLPEFQGQQQQQKEPYDPLHPRQRQRQ